MAGWPGGPVGNSGGGGACGEDSQPTLGIHEFCKRLTDNATTKPDVCETPLCHHSFNSHTVVFGVIASREIFGAHGLPVSHILHGLRDGVGKAIGRLI